MKTKVSLSFAMMLLSVCYAGKAFADTTRLISSSKMECASAALAEVESEGDMSVDTMTYYKLVEEYIKKSELLDESGRNVFNKYAKNIVKYYKNGTLTSVATELGMLPFYLKDATKKQTSYPAEWTGALLNSSFEDGMNDWECKIYNENEELTNQSFIVNSIDEADWAFASGNKYAYKVNTTDKPLDIRLDQDIDSVAVGYYKIKATVYTSSNTMNILGNENEHINVSPCTSRDEAKEIVLITSSVNGKRITIGATGTLLPGEKFMVDNIQLEYVGPNSPDEYHEVPDDVKCNLELKEKQKTSLSEFLHDQSPESLANYIEAVSNAYNSSLFYESVKVYLDSLKKVIESNSLTEEEKAVCVNRWNVINTVWDNETMTSNADCSVSYQVEKNVTSMVVTANSSVETIEGGKKYYAIIDLAPSKGMAQPLQLEISLNGEPQSHETRALESSETFANNLGTYIYSNDKEEVLVYECDVTQNMTNPYIQITAKLSEHKDYQLPFTLKGISLIVDETTTGIDVAEKAESFMHKNIYSLQGVRTSSLHKGVNVIRMNDGTVRKVVY